MASMKNNPLSILGDADDRHKKRVEGYAKQVDKLYRAAVRELSLLAAKVGAIPMSEQFSFSANHGIEEEVDKVLRRLASRIQSVIEAGDIDQWNAACVKGDALLSSIMKTSTLPREMLKRYQNRNLEALAAFQDRMIDGMGLSERVWNHVSVLKQEVETVVDTAAAYSQNGINATQSLEKLQSAIGTGLSADDLSREIRSCLKEPNRLFRRVRDKYGNLHLSKNAKLYHPGQGVYRSSYKNAMRMTHSEINMAYRQSDYLRWQQLDFVVGIRIQLSGNHTCLGKDGKAHPFFDICDILAGDYPKDFKHIGWHPQCRCIAIPILKPYDEWNEDRKYLDRKAYRQLPASNTVRTVPAAYTNYIRENRARIAGWQSTPYYIKDNPQYFDRALNPGRYAAVPLALAEDLYMRLSDMRMYGFNHQGSAKFNNALDEALKAQLAGDQKAFDDAMKTMEFTRKTNERAQEYAALKKAKEDLYLVLNAHPDYKDVKYDSKTGGIKATHKDHTFDPDKGQYERNARDAGYASGHVVILTSEKFGQTGQKFTEGKWDGLEFEIMGCETATPNNLVVGLKHSSSKKTTKIAVLEFPNGGFDADEMDRAIKRYAGIVKQKPENFIEFERVICTQNGKVVYDRPYKTVREAPVSRSTPRTANIEDITRMTKKLAAEINLDTSNLSVLKSRAAKKPIDPAQERHKYDAQIEELRKNAERYHLNMGKIMEAYVAMDLKKIEAAIREQQKIFEAGYAKKGKIYKAADKRHASRTPEKEKTLKDFMAQHKEKTLRAYEEFDDIIKEASGITEADVSVLRNLKTGKAGTTPTKAGEKVNASLERMREEAQKLKRISEEYNSAMSEAKALVDEFKGVKGVDADSVLKSRSIKKAKEEISKLEQRKRDIIDEAIRLKNEFDGVKDIDVKQMGDIIKKGKLSSILEASDSIREMKRNEDAISDLIPNAHELHKSYSLGELQVAHKELGGVLNKWLSKYSYSSVDNAPLAHLKNKLDFELSYPSFRYTNKTIIDKAINKKIEIINQKIEWDNLVSQFASLKSFNTKASAYRDLLAKVEDAISSKDFDALKKSIAKAEEEQRKILEKRAKRGGDTKTALNSEYKGGAFGTDISSTIDTNTMVSEDPYAGSFTNNVARLQGFDSPAKLVTEAEFNMLENNCGEVFYRTVNPTNFKGKNMTSEEFASQLYVADKLELNGPGGRVYGDGLYVATSAWDGHNLNALTAAGKKDAHNASFSYGQRGKCTIYEMTFTRKPRIITEDRLDALWNKLDTATRAKFGDRKYGGGRNTYACALGYDAMYCSGPNYMVIWNRSIMAIKKK